MKYIYIGQVKSGKLHISPPRRAQMVHDVSKIKEGKFIEMELRPLPRRSNPQNAYYWGVIVNDVREAMQNLGHEVTADEVHEFLKLKFNAKQIANSDGELIGEIGSSTAQLNTSGFMDYLAAIQRWAAQYLGIVILDPNEQSSLDLQ